MPLRITNASQIASLNKWADSVDLRLENQNSTLQKHDQKLIQVTGTQVKFQTNGTDNFLQSLYNLKAGNNVTLSAGNDGSVTVNAASSSVTFNQSAAQLWNYDSFRGTGQFSSGMAWNDGTNNHVLAFALQVYVPITIGHLSAQMANSVAGTVNFAIYDSTGTKKLLDAGSGFNSATAGVQTVALTTPVTIDTGVLWVATAASDGTSSAGVGWLTGSSGAWNNVAGTRVANAANSMSGGLMPSSLGTLTPASRSTLPGIFMCP